MFVKKFFLTLQVTVSSALSLSLLPLSSNTTYISSFQNLLNRIQANRLAAFKVCLKNTLQKNPVAGNNKTVGKCEEVLISAFQEPKAASRHKRRTLPKLRPPFSASIQNEIRLKRELRK
jgi:hypothetical protein